MSGGILFAIEIEVTQQRPVQSFHLVVLFLDPESTDASKCLAVGMPVAEDPIVILGSLTGI
jgi:hypothetical protein